MLTGTNKIPERPAAATREKFAPGVHGRVALKLPAATRLVLAGIMSACMQLQKAARAATTVL
jgi:hypothetical protein